MIRSSLQSLLVKSSNFLPSLRPVRLLQTSALSLNQKNPKSPSAEKNEAAEGSLVVPVDPVGQVEEDEVKTQKVLVRNVPTGVWKLNRLARQIRGLQVHEAMAQMALSPKMKASYVKRALFQGLSHAKHNQDLPSNHLYVKEAFVTRGPYKKAVDIKGRGRSGVMFKPISHLNVTLVHDPNHKTPVEKQKEKFTHYLETTTIKYRKIRSFP